MATSASTALQYQALGLSPVFARLLASRGWREADALVEFLYPRLEHTHSPWLMLGMKPAVERILASIEQGQAIRILGDYDADGTLATVILRQTLVTLGAEVSYQLPHRLEEGYGLQTGAIERAMSDGVGLAITVDTGIREFAPLARARELGLEVIVTDHHLPGEALPEAFAILNPHQPGCEYPDKNLCGSGVAFKLTHALLERAGRLEGAWPPRLRSYLKLVALATIADAVPLLGENRVLARFGLEGLEQPVNPGLKALLAMAMAGRREVRPPNSRDVAFSIAPRLNAAGRMGVADRVVELFFARAEEADAAAQVLEGVNQTRQQECERMEREILARMAADPAVLAGPVAVLAGTGWHRGVMGIIASRVMARTGRPVLVAAIEDGVAHGSGRAPEGVHLLNLLEGCRELFERFGGHAQAVGFTLPAERLGALQAALEAGLGAATMEAVAASEPGGFEISLAELTPAFARELARMEPFGEGNREPVFVVTGVRLGQAPQRLKERHLKLFVHQGGETHTALYWNLWRDGQYQTAPRRPDWEALRAPGCELDLVFRWEREQLILRDFFVTRGVDADSHTATGKLL